MSKARFLTLEAASYEVREETYEGASYLVVPVVALVQGVLHAMNSATPELVTAAEYTRPGVVGGFDGRPLFHGHPLVNGVPVSGNDPAVREAKRIGWVFHTAVKNNKLTTEAWVDVERCAEIAPDLLERIKAAQVIEISVGVFCETDDAETGEYEGKRYAGSWRDIVPDHLALLVEGDTGACSVEAGCGVRAAKEATMDSMYAEWLDLEGADEAFLAAMRACRNIPQSERDKMPAEDFAGPNRSFPIAEPEDVSAAASSLGRAKGNKDAIKKKIIAIAYRKGAEFVAKLPEDWKKKKDQKAAGMFARIMSMFRASQDPASMSDQDVRRTLGDALRKVDPRAMYPEAVYANAAEPNLVYCVYEGNDMVYYQRNYTMASDGSVSFGDPAEVEPVLSYEPVGPEVKAAGGQKDAAQGAPCSCHKGDNKDTRSAIDMKKEEAVKAIETATEAQLEALGKVFETPAAQVETPAAQVETPAVAAAAKTPTFAEVIAAASEADRDAFNTGKAAGEAKRAETIAALKATGRNAFSDQELASKSQAELDNLVKLAGSAKTDFSAAGAARVAEGSEAIPAAPSLTDAVRAARGTK